MSLFLHVRVAVSRIKKGVMLSLLSGGLVPYTGIVLDGLCNGNHEHCNVCMEEVTVTKVVVEDVLPVVPDQRPAYSSPSCTRALVIPYVVALTLS